MFSFRFGRHRKMDFATPEELEHYHPRPSEFNAEQFQLQQQNLQHQQVHQQPQQHQYQQQHQNHQQLQQQQSQHHQQQQQHQLQQQQQQHKQQQQKQQHHQQLQHQHQQKQHQRLMENGDAQGVKHSEGHIYGRSGLQDQRENIYQRHGFVHHHAEQVQVCYKS